MTLDQFFTAHATELKNRAKCVIEHRGTAARPSRRQRDGNPLYQVITMERIAGTQTWRIPEAYTLSGWVKVSPPPAGAKKAAQPAGAPEEELGDGAESGSGGDEDPGADAPAEEETAPAPKKSTARPKSGKK